MRNFKDNLAQLCNATFCPVCSESSTVSALIHLVGRPKIKKKHRTCVKKKALLQATRMRMVKDVAVAEASMDSTWFIPRPGEIAGIHKFLIVIQREVRRIFILSVLCRRFCHFVITWAGLTSGKTHQNYAFTLESSLQV